MPRYKASETGDPRLMRGESAFSADKSRGMRRTQKYAAVTGDEDNVRIPPKYA